MTTQRGFTLLELLVVIAIIALLSAIVIAMLNSARVSGRDSKRVADLREISTALHLYYDDFRTFPATLDALVPKYLPVMAKDPMDSEPYLYDQTGVGAGFHLAAKLESMRHDALKSDNDSNSENINGADAGDCLGGSTGRYCYDIVP